ncbi:hypothetical protein ES708_11908 [subsurface metagenome]
MTHIDARFEELRKQSQHAPTPPTPTFVSSEARFAVARRSRATAKLAGGLDPPFSLNHPSAKDGRRSSGERSAPELRHWSRCGLFVHASGTQETPGIKESRPASLFPDRPKTPGRRPEETCNKDGRKHESATQSRLRFVALVPRSTTSTPRTAIFQAALRSFLASATRKSPLAVHPFRRVSGRTFPKRAPFRHEHRKLDSNCGRPCPQLSKRGSFRKGPSPCKFRPGRKKDTFPPGGRRAEDGRSGKNDAGRTGNWLGAQEIRKQSLQGSHPPPVRRVRRDICVGVPTRTQRSSGGLHRSRLAARG